MTKPKCPNLKEEVSIRKVQETQKINIGTKDSPKYVNLGTGCTKKRLISILPCSNNFLMFLHGLMMI
jgi:hypothetical protein